MGIKKKNPPTTPFQPAVTLLTYALNADKQLVNINDVITITPMFFIILLVPI